jgi:dTDP-4-dehydrorhamnose 3,5-epimerase-like enzyme
MQVGLDHGFMMLESNAKLQYKVDGYYGTDHNGQIGWDVLDLVLSWSVNFNSVILSEKHAFFPKFEGLGDTFKYSGNG